MGTVYYPLINGHAFSFASIELSIGGVHVRGFKEIKYSHKREIGKLRGAGVHVLARTRGQYDAEGSLTMWLHEWHQLQSLMGNGWMEGIFTISVIYSEIGPLEAAGDALIGCTITSVEKGGSDGTEGLEVKVDFHIMDIQELACGTSVSPMRRLR